MSHSQEEEEPNENNKQHPLHHSKTGRGEKETNNIRTNKQEKGVKLEKS